MCFYDCMRFTCGDWKWGHFKAHCSKDLSTGETCGTKLVSTEHYVNELCVRCSIIEVNCGRIMRKRTKNAGWSSQSLRQTREYIADVENTIFDLHLGRPVNGDTTPSYTTEEMKRVIDGYIEMYGKVAMLKFEKRQLEVVRKRTKDLLSFFES